GEQRAVGRRLGQDAQAGTARPFGRQGLAQPGGELVGGRVAQRDGVRRTLAVGHVEITQQAREPLDVGAGVHHNQPVRRRIGGEDAVLPYQRRQHWEHGGGGGTAQRRDTGRQLASASPR